MNDTEKNYSTNDLISKFQDCIDVGNEYQVQLFADIVAETIPEIKLAKVSELALILLNTKFESSDNGREKLELTQKNESQLLNDELLSILQNLSFFIQCIFNEKLKSKLSEILIPNHNTINDNSIIQQFIKDEISKIQSLLNNHPHHSFDSYLAKFDQCTRDAFSKKIKELAFFESEINGNNDINYIKKSYILLISLFEISLSISAALSEYYIQEQETKEANKALMDQLQDKNDKISELKNQLNYSNKSNDILKTKLSEYEKRFDILQKEHDEQIHNLQNELQKSQKENIDLSTYTINQNNLLSFIDHLKSDNQKLKDSQILADENIKEKEKTIANQQSIIDELGHKILILEEECKTKEKSKNSDSIDNEKKILIDKLTEIKVRLVDNSQLISQMEEEKKNFQKSIFDLENQNLSLQNENKKYQKQITKVLRALGKKDETIQQLKSQNETTLKHSGQLKNKFEEDYQIIVAEFKNLEEQNNSLSKENSKKDDLIKELSNKIKELQQNLTMKNKAKKLEKKNQPKNILTDNISEKDSIISKQYSSINKKHEETQLLKIKSSDKDSFIVKKQNDELQRIIKEKEKLIEVLQSKLKNFSEFSSNLEAKEKLIIQLQKDVHEHNAKIDEAEHSLKLEIASKDLQIHHLQNLIDQKSFNDNNEQVKEIEILKSQIKDLTQQLQKSQNVIESLKKERAIKHQNMINSNHSNFSSQYQSIFDYQTSLPIFLEHQNKISSQSKSTRELTDLQKENDNLYYQIEEYKRKIESLSKFEQRYFTLETQIQQFEHEKELQNHEINNLQMKIQNLQSLNNSNQSQIHDLQLQNHSKNLQMQALMDDKDEYQKDNQKLKNELLQSSQLQNSTKVTLSFLQNANKNLQEKQLKYEKEISSLQLQISSLQQQDLENKQKNTVLYQQLKDKIESAEHSINTKNREIFKLHNELQTTRNNFDLQNQMNKKVAIQIMEKYKSLFEEKRNLEHKINLLTNSSSEPDFSSLNMRKFGLLLAEALSESFDFTHQKEEINRLLGIVKLLNKSQQKSNLSQSSQESQSAQVVHQFEDIEKMFENLLKLHL